MRQTNSLVNRVGLLFSLSLLLALPFNALGQARPNIVWGRSAIGGAISISYNGEYVQLFREYGTRIVRADNGRLVRIFQQGGYWLAEGHLLVFETNALVVVRVSDGAEVRRMARPVSANQQNIDRAFTSPTSTRIAVMGPSGYAAIWDVAAGTLVRRLPPGCNNEADAEMAFSPDGTVVAMFCGTFPNKVPVFFSAATGDEISRLSVTPPFFGPMSYSPDGTRIAIMDPDAGWHVFRVSDGAPVGTVNTQLTSIAWIDSDHLAAAPTLAPTTVRVWRVTDSTLVQTLDVGGSTPYPSGPGFVASMTGTLFTRSSVLSRWATVATTPVRTELPGVTQTVDAGITGLVWTSDGSRLVSTRGHLTGSNTPPAREIRVWDGATGAPTRVIDNMAVVRAAKLFPGSDQLVTLGDDFRLRVFDIVTGDLLRQGTVGGPNDRPWDLDISPNGQMVAVRLEDRIELRNSGDLSLIRTIPALGSMPAGRTTGVVFSPDGLTLAGPDYGVSPGREHLSVWRLDGTVVYRRDLTDHPDWRALAMAFSPDGSVIAVTGAQREVGFPQVRLGSVRIFRATDGALLTARNFAGAEFMAAFHSDGTLMTGGDNGLHVWNGERELVQRINGDMWPLSGGGFSRSGLHRVAFSPNTSQRRFAYGMDDGSVIVADLATQVTCVPTVRSTATSFGPAGGSATVTIRYPDGATGCQWNVAKPDPSFEVTLSAMSGEGDATLTMTAAPTDSFAPSSYRITIAGEPFQIVRSGCQFQLSGPTATLGVLQPTFALSVTTASGCAWAFASPVDWIFSRDAIALFDDREGSESIILGLTANLTGAERSAALVIGGQSVTVRQASSCAFALSPTSATVGNSGGSGQVQILTDPFCTWTAASQSSFLSISADSGSGPGTLTWTATRNSGPARTGTIAIALQTLTIQQAAADPLVPQNLAAQIAGTRVTLIWTPPATGGVTGYVLEAGTAPGASNVGSFLLGASPSVVVESAPAGTYYVRVRAVRSGAVSDPSNEIVIVIAAPGAPSQLASAVNGNTVTLTWAAPSSQAHLVATYIVEAGSAAGASNLAMFATGSTQTTLTVTGVPNGSYFVRVRAANAIGTSAPSNEVIVAVGPGACTSAPTAPTNLQSTVVNGVVTLTWVAPSSGAAPTSYRIDVGSSSGQSNLVMHNTGSTATTFSATAPSGTYFVRVRATNACGVSAATNEVVVTVP